MEQSVGMGAGDASGRVRVELGGEVRWATDATWNAVADELHAKYGGVPQVTREGAPPVAAALPVPPVLDQRTTGASVAYAAAARVARAPGGLNLTVPQPAPVAAPQARRGITIDEEGRARSQRDYEGAVAMGFAPRQPYYEEGTMVVQDGVARARRFRQEWERMPQVADYCDPFIERIKGEERVDVTVRWAETRMADDGALVLPGGERTRLVIESLGSYTALLGMYAAGGYLSRTWAELRAHNVNAYIDRKIAAETGERTAYAEAKKDREWEPHRGVVRVRKNTATSAAEREAYAFVSTGYTAFDVDKVAEALAIAAPTDARGRVSYDGRRARFEVLFNSTVDPEKYVAGEFFRAGVVISTDDTGGGALRGYSTVLRNLCLNLIMIDRSTAGIFSIRHTGTVRELAAEFAKGFERSLKSLEYFRKAWGFAVEQDAVEQARAAADEDAPLNIREVMPWLFTGIVERDLVPVFARTREAVTGLMQAWDKEPEPTRAGVINAVTRYAHERGDLDPWQEDAMQRAAGQLLYGKAGRAPAPLPLVNPDAKAEVL